MFYDFCWLCALNLAQHYLYWGKEKVAGLAREKKVVVEDSLLGTYYDLILALMHSHRILTKRRKVG